MEHIVKRFISKKMFCVFNLSYIIMFIMLMFHDPLAKYYQRSKKCLQGKALQKYQNLPEKGKVKKWQYDRERYRNLFENKK